MKEQRLRGQKYDSGYSKVKILLYYVKYPEQTISPREVYTFAQNELHFKKTLSSRKAIDKLIKEGYLKQSADRVCSINKGFDLFKRIAQECRKHDLLYEFIKTDYAKRYELEYAKRMAEKDVSYEEISITFQLLLRSPTAFSLWIDNHLDDIKNVDPFMKRFFNKITMNSMKDYYNLLIDNDKIKHYRNGTNKFLKSKRNIKICNPELLKILLCCELIDVLLDKTWPHIDSEVLINEIDMQIKKIDEELERYPQDARKLPEKNDKRWKKINIPNINIDYNAKL